jgi:putative autotransporter adhesin-like protein
VRVRGLPLFLAGAWVVACGGPGAEPPRASADAADAGKGSGKVRTETRTVAPFERVLAAGIVELKLAVGSPQAVTVTTDDNLLPSVRVETRGKLLRIETLGELRPSKAVRVDVVAPRFDEVRLEGTVAATIEGVAKDDADLVVQGAGATKVTLPAVSARSLDLALSGTSKADAREVRCKRLHVTLDGASAAVAVGTADELRVDNDGTGRAELAGLAARSVIAALNGASTAEVNVSESLRVRATGTAKLLYVGNPTKLDKDAQAPAEVRPK